MFILLPFSSIGPLKCNIAAFYTFKISLIFKVLNQLEVTRILRHAQKLDIMVLMTMYDDFDFGRIVKHLHKNVPAEIDSVK